MKGQQRKIHALYQGRKNHYRRQSENRTRFVLGICVESGCDGKTLGTKFCRKCLAKKAHENGPFSQQKKG